MVLFASLKTVLLNSTLKLIMSAETRARAEHQQTENSASILQQQNIKNFQSNVLRTGNI